MTIKLGKTQSEPNKLHKTITHEKTIEGTLRAETSIIAPVILIEDSDNLSEYNYATISAFGRKYFVKDITSVRKNLWRLSLDVDVLGSWEDEISDLHVILKDSENRGDNYLTGSQWRNKVKSLTNILPFSTGLLDNGTYILITAGG